MSLLSRLFGNKGGDAGSKPAAEGAGEDYKGYRIIPQPAAEGKGYRIGARIEKTIDGEVKVHHLIRADTMPSREDVDEASIAKARQMIDEQGDRIFR